MYKIRRLSLEQKEFAGISQGRDTRDKYKYQVLNHLVLYMLSSDYLVYDLHWRDEILEFTEAATGGYDLKSFKNNFDYSELFDGFLNETSEYNTYIQELKKKFSEERKKDSNDSIEYPEKFIKSKLLKDIITWYYSSLNEWVSKNGKKPKFTGKVESSEKKYFLEELTNIREANQNELDKYAIMYGVRYYSE